MWKKLLSRASFRKSSFSTDEMGLILFALAVGTDGDEGQHALSKDVDMVSTDGLDPEVARIELALLKFSAVYIALFRSENLQRLHGSKLDEVQRAFLARLKERARPSNLAGEEAFLRASEARLAAYNKAFDAWVDADKNGRSHEQTFAIGETFFGFCGVQNVNPVTLSLIRHKFITTLASVDKTLRSCTLE